MREPPQHAVRPFVKHQRVDDGGAEPRHSRRQPLGHTTAVERKVCGAGTRAHTGVQYSD
jgi:hypothetical protein